MISGLYLVLVDSKSTTPINDLKAACDLLEESYPKVRCAGTGPGGPIFEVSPPMTPADMETLGAIEWV